MGKPTVLPGDVTAALRPFAIGILKARSRDTVAATLQRLAPTTRLVFDYLRMTGNSRRPYPPSPVQVAPVG